MKQKYISYWQHTLQHSQKLEFYRSFKNEYVTSSYLELTSRVSDRRTLTKLRISNHKLMIELGRYNNTPRENRLCPVCDCNTVQPRYNDPRYNDIPDITMNMRCPGKSYSKMYGTEPRYNDLRYNDIPDITM